METKTKQLGISDKYGNSIIRDGNKLFLKIKNKKPRFLGTLWLNNMLLVKRNRAMHLHVKSNSYGFNHFLISNARLFNKVYLHDDFGEYIIPNKVILEKGKILYFKEQGFELQLFLDIETIDKHKIERSEK